MVTDTAPPGSARDALRGGDRRRRFLRTRVLAHRRLLACCCVVIAVASALHVLAPPAPATVQVRVAAGDVAAGSVLRASDLTWASYAAGTVPDGMAQAPVGRTTTGPLRRGEPITDARLLTPEVMVGHQDRIAVPVRLPDPAVAALLRAGDSVDLLAADPSSGRAATVARDARVVTIPREEESRGGQGQAGRVVVLALAPEEVEAVTVAGVQAFLTLAWSR